MGGGSVRPNINLAFPGDAVTDRGGEPMISCPDRGNVAAEEIFDDPIGALGYLTADQDGIRLVGLDGVLIARSARAEGLADCIRGGLKYSGRLESDGEVHSISFWQG